MSQKLRKLIFLEVLSFKAKLFLGSAFLLIIAEILSFYLIHGVKADNKTFTEDFTTTTYEDVSATSGNWDTTIDKARLTGGEWYDMTETTPGFENISNNSGNSHISVSALASDNNPYVVWADTTSGNGDIYFKKWTPAANAWTGMDGISAFDNLSTDAFISDKPQIALDSLNNPYVVWQDNDGGSRKIYFTKWTPGTGWTKMDGITLGYESFSSNSVDPKIKLDSAGNPIISWEDQGVGTGDIMVTRWTPGTGWTKMDGTILPNPYDNISNNGSLSYKAQIVLDSNNLPYVAWIDFTTDGVGDIYFSKWTPGPGPGLPAWTKMDGITLGYDNLSSSAFDAHDIEIVLDSANNPYIVWSEAIALAGNREIFFRKWTPGTGWTGMDGILVVDNLSNSGMASAFPQIILTSGNIPYIAWSEARGVGWLDIAITKWTPGISKWTKMNGITLGFDFITNFGDRNAELTDFKFNSLEQPYILFSTHSLLLPNELYSTRWNGTTWTKLNGIDEDNNILTFEKDNLSTNTVYEVPESNMLISSDDKPLVFWTDTSAGNNEIYFSKLTSYGLTPEIVQSLTLNSPAENIISARLSANQNLNSQTINYFLSNDGGTTWEAVTIGTLHQFSTSGNDLRWRAILSTTETSITPAIDQIDILYQTAKIVCALDPPNLEVGADVTISATVENFTATNVWATIKNNGNLINTVNLDTSNNIDYSVAIHTTSNYLGDNDVAVFATDSVTSETYTCNLSDNDLWEEQSYYDIPWYRRQRQSVLVFQNKIWSLGGYSKNETTNEVWMSTNGVDWTLMPTPPWSKRGELAAVVYNNKIYVLAGVSTDFNTGAITFYNDVWSSLDGQNWTQVTSSAPWSGRSSPQAVVYNNKIYLTGGCDHATAAGACDHTVNDVWTYDGTNWTQLLGIPWPDRGGHQTVVYDDGSGEKIWLMGGRTSPVLTLYNDVWTFDGSNWTQLKFCQGGAAIGKKCTVDGDCPLSTCGNSAPWEARIAFSSLVYDDGVNGSKIYLVAGVALSGSHNDIWTYDNSAGWTKIKNDVAIPAIGVQPSLWGHFTPRYFSPVVAFNPGTGNKLWLLSGTYMYNDIWSSQDGITWTLINNSLGSQYLRRFGAIVASYDNKLWLMGGSYAGTLGNDLWSSTDGRNWQCEIGTYTSAVEGIDCLKKPSDFPAYPQARWGGNALVYDPGSGKKLYILGGCITTTGFTNCLAPNALDDVWSYDGSTWTQEVLHAPWGTRYLPKATVFDNKIFFTSGSMANKDVWYSTDGAAWTQMKFCQGGVAIGKKCTADGDCPLSTCGNNAPWTGRVGASLISHDDGSGEKLWLMGGLYSPPYTYLNDVWSLGTAPNAAWTRATASAGWTARYTFGLVDYNNKMWVFGGNKIGTLPIVSLHTNDVWSSNDGANWTLVTNNAGFEGRDFLSYTVHDNRIFVMNGDSWLGTVNDVWASKYNYLNFHVATGSGPPPPPFPGDVAPSVPSLQCEALSNTAIDWNITRTSTNETGFKLYEPNIGGDLLKQDINSATIQETDLTTNTQYTRYVTAYNTIGESGKSNEVSCYTKANVPASLLLGEVTNNSIILKINPSDGNPDYTQYAIWEIKNNKYVQADGTFGDNEVWQTYQEWGGEQGIRVTGTSQTAALLKNIKDRVVMSLTSGTKYSFAVKAENGDNKQTDFSASIDITTEGTAPSTPPTPPTPPEPTPPTPPIPPEPTPPTPPIPPEPTPPTPPTPPGPTPPTPPGPTPPGPTPVTPSEKPAPIISILTEGFKENPVVNYVMENVINNPEVEKASKNVVTPLLVTLALINTIPSALMLTSYLLPHLNLLFAEPFLIFFRRKRKKWGVVYDALRKTPLDLALVRLYNKKTNKLVQTKVTDKMGRYHLVVKEKGKYYLSATRMGYNFPTKYLKDEKQDIKFLDLYHGEAVEVTEKDAVITANIPLDPQLGKIKPVKEIITNYLIKNIRLIIAYIGLVLAALVFLIYPSVITGISIFIHIILFVLFRRIIIPRKPKSWGIIYDQKSKNPLHYAVVRIFDTKFNKLLETQVTDSKGRYAFLVGNNKYELLAEKEGYQKKQIKPVDLIKKEEIVNLDVGLQKTT